MINWRLIGTIFLFAIGVYMCFAYQETDDLSADQKQEYQRNRYIGFALIALSIGLCIYFYYTGAIFLNKALMPGDCEDCDIYIERYRSLRPYTAGEIKTLATHAQACQQCSNMCMDRLSLAERAAQRGIKSEGNVEKIKQGCIRSTKHAILAKNELARLAKKTREKYGKFWREYPDAPPIHFPEAPE